MNKKSLNIAIALPKKRKRLTFSVALLTILLVSTVLGALYWTSQLVTKVITVSGIQALALKNSFIDYTQKSQIVTFYDLMYANVSMNDSLTIAVTDQNVLNSNNLTLGINIAGNSAVFTGFKVQAYMAWKEYFMISGWNQTSYFTDAGIESRYNNASWWSDGVNVFPWQGITAFKNVTSAVNLFTTGTTMIIPWTSCHMMYGTPPNATLVVGDPLVNLAHANSAQIFFVFDTSGCTNLITNQPITVAISLGIT